MDRRSINHVYSSRLGLEKSGAVKSITDGVDRSGSTGTYVRQTQEIVLFKPFILSTVLWDIGVTGNYTFRLVASLSATTPLPAFGNLVTADYTAGADVAVIPYRPIVMAPGLWYLQMYNNAGTNINWDYFSSSLSDNMNRSFFSLYRARLMTTGGSGSVSISTIAPIKLVGVVTDNLVFSA